MGTKCFGLIELLIGQKKTELTVFHKKVKLLCTWFWNMKAGLFGTFRTLVKRDDMSRVDVNIVSFIDLISVKVET